MPYKINSYLFEIAKPAKTKEKINNLKGLSSALINFISKNNDQTKNIIPYNIAQEYGKV